MTVVKSARRSIKPPTNGTDQIFAIVRELLRTWLADNPGVKIRLLGVGGSNLSPVAQPDLFAADKARSPSVIDETVDEIREKFGSSSLGRARILDRH